MLTGELAYDANDELICSSLHPSLAGREEASHAFA
jgi:hypothetical protein